MFNLIMVTNQNKLLTHFQKVLSHNFTLDKCYPQKCSGNLKVTSTLFLMSSLSCPKHSTLPQHTYLYVNPLNNLYPYPTAPSLFTSHMRQFSSNEAKNYQGMKNLWKQWPGKSSLHTTHK